MEARPAPPIPASVSPQARALLSQPRSETVYPPIDDRSAWSRLIDGRQAELVDYLNERLAPVIDLLPMIVDDSEMAGVHTFVIRADNGADDVTSPLYLDIHGGALITGGGEACRLMGTARALTVNMPVWAIDYRMPPQHLYPAALDDCLAVYQAALQERAPSEIFVGGTSAGGNLAAALLLRAKDAGLPMPAGLVLITPELDLTESGDSFVTNNGIDNILGPLLPVNQFYAAGHDLSHPYLSPLFGDVTRFPPTFLTAGTRDLFLSNAVRMHRKLRTAGVEADLHIWEAMPHGGFGGGAPEDMEMVTELQTFLAKQTKH
jgi:epsilon-lactone hydrolase